VQRASRERFAALAKLEDERIDLAEAALLIACEEYPALDVAHYLARLDGMAESVRPRIQRQRTRVARVLALNEYLFQDEGFSGNAKDYYDPRNSFLNDVLERRTGIPISLSAVYVEVARRAGIHAQGVGFPGHFLVKIPGDGDLVVDPFDRGALLSAGECQKRLDRMYAGRVTLAPEMLAAVGARPILTRMLRNLKAIYARQADALRGIKILDLLLLLNPRSAVEWRDRGLLHASLDCYAPAARDFETYVGLAPEAPDAASYLPKILELKARAARLN
jgi:regulator of sirC expression with transglutaminase-like and TPR domain